MKTIGHRYWSKEYPVFYVSHKIGKIGDWGYTTKASEAIHLSPYWRRRFAADCKRVGTHANFTRVLRNEVGNTIYVNDIKRNPNDMP